MDLHILNDFHYFENELIVNLIIKRFLDSIKYKNNKILYNDKQNIHSNSIQESTKQSILNLLNDTYDNIIKKKRRIN